MSKASTRQIREAAVALRRAQTDRKRGRTTTAAEEATLAGLRARVQGAEGFERVQLALVAMGAKRGADLKIRVPLAQATALAKLLSKGPAK